MPNGGSRVAVAALAAFVVALPAPSSAAAAGQYADGFEPAAFFLDPPLATVAAPGGEVYTAIDGDRVPTTLVIGRVTAAGVDRTYSDYPPDYDMPGQWLTLDATAPYDSFRPTGLARQADGKFVVVGTYDPDGFEQGAAPGIGVIRVLPSGDLDPSFDGDGKALVPVPTASALTAGKVAVGSTGRIVVSAVERSATSELVAVYAVGAGGKPDKTFGTQGRAVALGGPGNTVGGVGSPLTNPPPATYPGEEPNPQVMAAPKGSLVPVSLVSNGKILTGGGVCDSAGACSVSVVRLTGKGAADTTFSGDGRVDVPAPVTPATFGYYDVHALAGGHVLTVTGNGATDVVARIRPDGSFNPSFGTGGVKTLPGVGQIVASAVQPDGKVLTRSNIETVKDGRVWVLGTIIRRWYWNGSRDAGFGKRVTAGVNSGYVPRYAAFGVGAEAGGVDGFGMQVATDNSLTTVSGHFAGGDGAGYYSGEQFIERFQL